MRTALMRALVARSRHRRPRRIRSPQPASPSPLPSSSQAFETETEQNLESSQPPPNLETLDKEKSSPLQPSLEAELRRRSRRQRNPQPPPLETEQKLESSSDTEKKPSTPPQSPPPPRNIGEDEDEELKKIWLIWVKLTKKILRDPINGGICVDAEGRIMSSVLNIPKRDNVEVFGRAYGSSGSWHQLKIVARNEDLGLILFIVQKNRKERKKERRNGRQMFSYFDLHGETSIYMQSEVYGIVHSNRIPYTYRRGICLHQFKSREVRFPSMKGDKKEEEGLDHAIKYLCVHHLNHLIGEVGDDDVKEYLRSLNSDIPLIRTERIVCRSSKFGIYGCPVFDDDEGILGLIFFGGRDGYEYIIPKQLLLKFFDHVVE